MCTGIEPQFSLKVLQQEYSSATHRGPSNVVSRGLLGGASHGGWRQIRSAHQEV
jgi:hypothetical protein